MKITAEIQGFVQDAAKAERSRWRNAVSDADAEELIQDVYVKVLEHEKPSRSVQEHCGYLVWSTFADFVRKESNRRQLERENDQAIIKHTTPSLSDRTTGGPEEFAISEQELRRRWVTLSSLLRRVARRTFFGYQEEPEKVARELGMTVAAVNMARTRIKQHMNGADDAS